MGFSYPHFAVLATGGIPWVFLYASSSPHCIKASVITTEHVFLCLCGTGWDGMEGYFQVWDDIRGTDILQGMMGLDDRGKGA